MVSATLIPKNVYLLESISIIMAIFFLNIKSNSPFVSTKKIHENTIIFSLLSLYSRLKLNRFEFILSDYSGLNDVLILDQEMMGHLDSSTKTASMEEEQLPMHPSDM